jgi:putative peptidoglycan lipid II flippase
MGTTFLANTYQTANTAPNVVFELVAAGVLTSVFVPTFVEYLARGEREESWEAANALTSVALVALVALAAAVALGAPWILRLLTIGVADQGLRAREVALGSDFLRLFAPQVILYGAGMIMTGALQAHRRFGLPAVAPIFNNVIVIGVYLAYAASRGDSPPAVGSITGGQTLLLGLGTTAGVLAMTICLIPALRQLGWRWHFNFAPSHPAVRRGARLGVWALGYAGGYQAGLIVVLIFANRVAGGVVAYQWAFTYFYLPHALFAVPIFSVLFTAMSEHVARGEERALVSRLQDGLGMLIFILLPLALVLLLLAAPIARVTLDYGVMTGTGALLVARVMQAFAIGLPAYSLFLVFTRAFYAMGDTKTPAIVNAVAVVVASGGGIAFFEVLPDRWSVPGLALGHTLGMAVGASILGSLLKRRVGTIIDPPLWSRMARQALASLVAALGLGLGAWVLRDADKAFSVAGLLVTLGAAAVLYLFICSRLAVPEIGRLRKLIAR